MIARIWTGEVLSERAEEYVRLMRDIAIPDYRSISGNWGAWCLHRALSSTTQVTMLSFWESIDSIREFAGEQIDSAMYYPFDKGFLTKMPDHVSHFTVES